MNIPRMATIGLAIFAILASVTGSYSETTSPTLPSDSPKERAKWRLATLSAAREILDELNQPTALSPEARTLLVEKLNQAMRADLPGHASRSASQRLCRDIAIRMRQEQFDRQFQTVLAHANEQSSIPILWSDVTAHLGASWSNAMEKALQSVANSEQLPLFNDARARAIGLLRQELEQQLRFPNESEVNEFLETQVAGHPESLHLTREDETRLQQKVLALANPDRNACFEELKQALHEQTGLISSEIRKQYERQLTSLEKAAAQSIPDDRRHASTIALALLSSLESDLAKERTQPGTPDVSGKPVPLYAVLAPVRNSVPGLATKLETGRLAAFLAQSPCLAIQPDPLAKAIRSEPDKHPTLAASQSVFLGALAPALKEKAALTYAAGATPAGEASYFTVLLTTNGLLTNAFETRLTRELHTSLMDARQTVSDEQFKKSFSALERNERLSPEAFRVLQDSGGAALTTLTEAVKLFGVSVRDRDTYLAETVSRVLTLANRKAKEGYEVLTTQLALVSKLEQARLDTLRQEVTARRPYKDIRCEWQAALETAWAADSRAQATPYKDILDLTLAHLNKTVRQLYDSIQESPSPATAATPSEARPNSEAEQGKIKDLRQNPAKPEEQNPEPPKEVQPPVPKTSPKDGGSEGAADAVLSRTRVDRRNEPDGILLLTGAATGPATARLLSQTGVTNCNVSFDPGKPQDAATAIFEAMTPQLKALWTNTVHEWQKEHSGLGFLKRRTPPKLKLFIVIESEDVRHRMSLMLRQHIEDALTAWGKTAGKGTPDVELDWKVGLTFDQPATTP
ncbi:MAG: hypothetical protein WCS52_01405 [bacterium]